MLSAAPLLPRVEDGEGQSDTVWQCECGGWSYSHRRYSHECGGDVYRTGAPRDEGGDFFRMQMGWRCRDRKERGREARRAGPRGPAASGGGRRHAKDNGGGFESLS